MTPPLPVEAGASPAMHPYQSTFSEEEIHDFLGAMNGQGEQESADGAAGNGDEASNGAFPGSEISAETRAKARSERKRSREKQRREDVNKQFADLSQLLRTIETEDLDDDARLPLATTSPTNRVDLIARTICILERIHKVNKSRKDELADAKKQLKDANKMAEDTAARLKEATLYQQPGPTKPMMMMVPMMVNPETMGGAGAAAGYQMAPQQFMPQQMMMMPQMQQQMPAAAQAPTASAPASATNANAPAPSVTMPNMMQQMQPQQMQAMMQQMQPQQMNPMQSFSTMMYAQPQAPVASAPPTGAPTANGQPQPQQQGGKQGSPNVSGGNLAHCA